MALSDGLDISLSMESGLNEDGFLDDDFSIRTKEFKCVCFDSDGTQEYFSLLLKNNCKFEIISQSCCFDKNFDSLMVITSFWASK